MADCRVVVRNAARVTHRRRAIGGITGWARGRLPGFVFLLLALPTRAASAQWLQPSVGIGAASVRYAETLETTMLSLTPTVSWLGTRGVVTATGVIASTAVQGLVAAAFTTSFDAPLAAELALLTGGSRSGAAVTTQSRLTGRVQLRTARAGLWVGTGLGAVADGSAQSTTRVHDLGAWLALGAVDLTLTQLPTAAGDSVRFTDTELGVRWQRERLTLEATAGRRGGTARVTGLDDPGAWQSLTGSLRLSDRVALVAGAGSYPLDLLQGFPAGRFTTISLRFTPARAGSPAADATLEGGDGARAIPDAPARTASAADAGVDATGLSTLVVRTLEDGRRRLRVRAVGATTVELQGSMTDWATVPLVAEGDGWFAVELDIPAGAHELVLRRDGGGWVVPPGLSRRVDEFGVTTGVLIVGG